MSPHADHDSTTEPSSATASPAGPQRPAGGRWARAALWLPGFVVAIGAAVATAHGLYEVAAASRVPAPIAWLYPLITDGLALVAYIATARLSGSAARYAWSVVILAAGLSGLAQAAFLAGEAEALDAPPWLRFGIGAWPAVAAAIVAHLLYLLAAEPDARAQPLAEEPERAQPEAPSWTHLRTTPVAVQRTYNPAVQADLYAASEPRALRAASDGRGPVDAPSEAAATAGGTGVQAAFAFTEDALGTGVEIASAAASASPRERAVAAAVRRAEQSGALPTVSELEALAEVSRGTAATALRSLRNTEKTPTEPDSEATQP